MWSMNVSFTGHAQFFYQTVNTYDISNTPERIALHSLNWFELGKCLLKRPNYSQT